MGAACMSTVVIPMPGASGSCRCNTSNSSFHSALISRTCADMSGAIGAMLPLAAVGKLAHDTSKTEDLFLDAAWYRKAVRADHADAHGAHSLALSANAW